MLFVDGPNRYGLRPVLRTPRLGMARQPPGPIRGLERPRVLRSPIDCRETLAFAVLFLASDAEQHYRSIVDASTGADGSETGKASPRDARQAFPKSVHNSSSQKEG